MVNFKILVFSLSRRPVTKIVFSAVVITLLVISCLLAIIPTVTAITITAPTAGTSGNVGDSVTVSGTSDTFGGMVSVYWDVVTAWDGTRGLLAEGYATGTTYNVATVIPETTAGTHYLLVRDVSAATLAFVPFIVQPEITLTPNSGIPGDAVTVSGTGFDASSSITLTLESTTLLPSVFMTINTSVTTTASGSFAVSIVIPSSITAAQFDTYILTATDATAHSDTALLYVGSFIAPVAYFTYSPASPIAGEDVVFDAFDSYDTDGTLVSYYWEISDAVTGELMTSFFGGGPYFSSPFPVSGVYNVTLTVTDNSFLSDSITHQVTIIEAFDLTIENEGYAGSTSLDAGTYSYAEGTDVEVWFFEIVDGKWVFDYWLLDGVNVGSANSITVTMDEDHVLTALSHIQYAFLGITLEGSGTTFPPVTAGSLGFNIGTPVTVNATPSEGWTFDYWKLDGSNVGTANPYTVLMDDDHQLTAVFTPGTNPPLPSVNLTIQVDGSGSTNPSVGDYTFDEDSTVVVDAAADDGWKFGYWLLDGVNVSSSASYSVLMDANHVLRAVFTELPQQQCDLTVDVVGSGYTTLGTGVHMFNEGSTITVIAYPSDGWRLDCWMLNGQNVSTEEMFIYTLSTNSSLTAVFVEIQQPLIPPAYVIPIIVVGGIGAAGIGYVAYRRFYPKTRKNGGKGGEKTDEGQESKDEDERKRKKAKLVLTLLECPKAITGKMAGEAKIQIRNVGTDSARNVLISIFSTKSLQLQNRTAKISLIPPFGTCTKVFKFTLSPNANRGEHRLRFAAKGDNTETVTEGVTVRAIKIGLLSGSGKEQPLTVYRNWFRSNSLTWDDLTSADNVMKLLSYDAILVAPDFDMPAKWVRVLQSYADNDRLLLKPNKTDTIENEISEKLLALLKK